MVVAVLALTSSFGFDDPARQESDRVMTERKTVRSLGEAGAYLDQFRAEAIKPLPLPRVSHENPPHEGAMIDWPIVLEPPDLITVEVLEGIPGRPITGERLVRQDGTISLEFYGSLYVRGLTPLQVKEKVILHLRKYINDETLGLIESVEPGGDAPDEPEPKQPSPGDQGERSTKNSAMVRNRMGTGKSPASIRRTQRPANARLVRPVRRAVAQVPAVDFDDRMNPNHPESVIPPSEQKSVKSPQENPTIRIDGGQAVKITIEVQGKGTNELVRPESPTRSTEEAPAPDEGPVGVVPPRDSDRVFVDVTAYNHDVFFVLGDVNAPGRLPFTGNETVLDAMRYAGGLSPTADAKDVRLVRPARGGVPAHAYKIDLDAIENKGDARANLQILPGDRLVVGEDSRIQLGHDRVGRDATLFSYVYSSLKNQSEVADLLAKILGQKTLTARQRERFIKGWGGLWWPDLLQGPGHLKDEKAVRKALQEIIEQINKEASEGSDQ